MFEKLKLKLLVRKIRKYDRAYLNFELRSKLDFTDIELPNDIDYTKPVLVFIGYEPVFIYKEPQWNVYVCYAPHVPLFHDSYRDVWEETKVSIRIFHNQDWRHHSGKDHIPEAIKEKVKVLILKNKDEYLKIINGWKDDYEKAVAAANKEKYGKTFSKNDC